MSPNKVLFWHGYKLSHSGSNVYAASVTGELAKLGDSVTLMCQDKQGANITGVKVLTPDIQGLLPVYVLDEYEGYIAKRFVDLSGDELRRYIGLNRAALRDAIAAEKPDVVHVNHAVVGPFMAGPVCREAGLPMIVTVQGSDMLFAAGESKLYRRLARLGLAQADIVVVLSRFGAGQAIATLGTPDWLAEKTVIVSPGVDAATFHGEEKATAALRLIAAYGTLAKHSPGGIDEAGEAGLKDRMAVTDWSLPDAVTRSYGCRLPDADITDKLRSARLEKRPVVAFVGNLMATKGAQYLVAAAPYILDRHPEAIVVLAGFGSLRAHLESLLFSLEAGDEVTARRIAVAIDESLGRTRTSPPRLTHFLDRQTAAAGSSYYDMCGSARLSERVLFTGMIEHAQSRHLLALADVAVVPSVMPESFGIVAAEAMAAGALTVMSRQSALSELADWEAGVLELPVADIGPECDDDFVSGLARSVSGLLSLGPESRATLSKRLAVATARDYSWDSVAHKLDRLYTPLVNDRLSQAG